MRAIASLLIALCLAAPVHSAVAGTTDEQAVSAAD